MLKEPLRFKFLYFCETTCFNSAAPPSAANAVPAQHAKELGTKTASPDAYSALNGICLREESIVYGD